MTREENRNIIECMKPLFEKIVCMANQEEVAVKMYSNPDDENRYAFLRVGDYEILMDDECIQLQYKPMMVGARWENEWMKKRDPLSNNSDGPVQIGQ